MMTIEQLVIVMIVVVVVLALLARGQGGGVPNVRARPLLTAAEIGFLKILRAAAAPLHVAPQVAMGALLQAGSGLDNRERLSVRNRFDRKIVDFVLIDDAGAVKLIVELDDRTHREAKDATRDAMMARAGYQTLRLRGPETRDVEAVRCHIADCLAPSQSDGMAVPDAARVVTLRTGRAIAAARRRGI